MSKVYLSLMVFFFNCFAGGLLHAHQNDEASVKTVVENFVNAWNKHDPKAMSAQWAEKGDLIDPWGNWAVGKAGVEKFFTKDQSGDLGKTTMAQTVDAVRFPAPDVAFVDVNAEIKGLYGDGKLLPPYKHHVVYLIVKENGAWKILAARPYALQGPLTHFLAK